MSKTMQIFIEMPIGETGVFKYEPNRNADGLINLTDLWRRFGEIKNKEPRQWERLPEAKKFLAALCTKLNVEKADVWKATRGNGGSTWAHSRVYFRYMQYLHESINSNPPESWTVYFLKCEVTGLIKIGTTSSSRRIRAIQTMNSTPIKLLKIIPGGYKEERALHKRFALSRHHGEWFKPGADLMDYINNIEVETN